MKYAIRNRWAGEVIFEAEIDCAEDESEGVKRGLAVKCAVKAGINLSDANMRYANLTGANMSGANLSDANMSDADMSGTNLRYANMRYANLTGANMSGVKNISYQICPQQGSFQAWKVLTDGHIALLEIPAKAKRTSSIVGRKCRAEYVKVLKIYNREGEIVKKPIGGWRNKDFMYEVGGYH